MGKQKESDDRKGAENASSSSEGLDEAGDPGRTPGTAEGDEQTVEEDLRAKEGGRQK